MQELQPCEPFEAAVKNARKPSYSEAKAHVRRVIRPFKTRKV